ncbi:MAG TPA: PDZ domain-containing protein [Planctomycetota bacterium]|nr:PDZ domain-containing protein [Planctomycetota bacterium]
MAKRMGVLLAALAATLAAQEKTPGYLGVRIAPVDAETRAALAIPEGVEEGVVILDAMPDAPAARAGLKRGDVLVRFAGAPVRTPEELVAAVRARAAGEEVGYVLVRGDGRIEGKLTLAGSPPEAPPASLDERLDRLQRNIEELQRRRAGKKGPATVADWRKAEERKLEEARARGDRDAVRRGEIRVQLLKEMEAEGVRGLGERVDRIERKLDRILEKLGER